MSKPIKDEFSGKGGAFEIKDGKRVRVQTATQARPPRKPGKAASAVDKAQPDKPLVNVKAKG